MAELARREFKFLIDESIATQIRTRIDGFCEPDKHATSTGGRYLCDTLYFDTHQRALYRATIQNAASRYKLRIRGYPQTPQAPVFLEVKRRVAETIIKSRAAIDVADLPNVIEEATLDRVPEREQLAAEKFLSLLRASRHGMVVPQVMVRYEREPYTSRVDHYARVTFDRDIRFQPHPEPSMTPGESWTQIDDPRSMWPVVGSPVLLELKFLSSGVPRWMRSIVERLELRRLAYCKYARAIDVLLDRPSARQPRFAFG